MHFSKLLTNSIGSGGKSSKVTLGSSSSKQSKNIGSTLESTNRSSPPLPPFWPLSRRLPPLSEVTESLDLLFLPLEDNRLDLFLWSEVDGVVEGNNTVSSWQKKVSKRSAISANLASVSS